MKKTLTYLDAGVIIAAVAGKTPLSDLALDIITDPSRSLVVSSLLTLETLPSATYLRDRAQIQAINNILASADLRVLVSENLINLAVSEASKILGIRAIDALHLTAAKFAGAQELERLQVECTGQKHERERVCQRARVSEPHKCVWQQNTLPDGRGFCPYTES